MNWYRTLGARVRHVLAMYFFISKFHLNASFLLEFPSHFSLSSRNVNIIISLLYILTDLRKAYLKQRGCRFDFHFLALVNQMVLGSATLHNISKLRETTKYLNIRVSRPTLFFVRDKSRYCLNKKDTIIDTVNETNTLISGYL